MKNEIKWLFSLRWFAIAGQLAVLPFAIKYNYVGEVNTKYYLIVTLMTLILNFLLFFKATPKILSNVFFNISWDLLAFTLLVLLTGKADNPFINFLYLHTIIGALFTSRRTDHFYFVFLCLSLLSIQLSSPHYFTSAVFNFLPQWILLIILWISSRSLTKLLQHQESIIKDLERKKSIFEKNKSISLFTSGVLHEIATPMNTIRLIINKLQRSKEIDQNAEKIEIINHNLSRIENVTDSLRKLQFDITNSIEEEVILNTIINSHIDNFHKDEDLKIIFNKTINYLVISNQLILNLLLSTIISNTKETSATELKIEIKDIENRIHIYFQDNGEGFTEEVIENFKSPYNSTKGSGRGLGLYNCCLSLSSLGSELLIYNNNGACIEVIIDKAIERKS